MQNDASLLQRIVNENGIESFALDLDNTFLHTSDYYKSHEYMLSLEFSKRIKTLSTPDDFAEEMAVILKRQYSDRHGKPILVAKRYELALAEFLQKGVEEKDLKRIEEFYRDFYTKCPEVIDGAIEVLGMMMDLHLPYIFNSNAQDGWTKAKVIVFEELLKIESIPYNAVEIDKEKDAQSWIDSVKKINVSIENSLVIGDSLRADILTGIEAGCRNLVWIEGDLNKIPEEIKEEKDIHIWCVDSVKDLL
ncbi:HAD hydrolase-like protein [Patescibacteria group bacterium]|nr:HAD hydrolase-like protein [Patescibacteria group bacterium]